MVKMTYQNCGSNWVVFIKGDTQIEIEQQYYSLWNWNATSGELDWLQDDLAKIWTSKARLLRYFQNICLNELIDTRASEFEGVKGGALSKAKEMAKERFDTLEKTDDSIVFGREYEPFTMGKISAEKPDEDLKDYFLRRAFEN